MTVTTKAKDYIFILHSAGMTSVKVQDLSPEARQQLGYVEKAAPQAKPALSWLKKTTSVLEKRENPQLQQIEQRMRGWEGAYSSRVGEARWFPWALLGGALFCYCGLCCCLRAICQKAGHPPGFLIWLPLLQWIPLLRAAGMSAWWLLACLLPGVGVLVYVVWSCKIVRARGKGAWLVLPLLLPGLHLLVLLYLALADAAESKEAPVVEIMTLDAA